MSKKWLQYNPVYSAIPFTPAEPMVIVEAYFNPTTGDEEFSIKVIPVIGVVCKVIGSYERSIAFDGSHSGPSLPPSAKHLREEGFKTSHGHRTAQYAYIVGIDPDYGGGCDNPNEYEFPDGDFHFARACPANLKEVACGWAREWAKEKGWGGSQIHMYDLTDAKTLTEE